MPGAYRVFSVFLSRMTVFRKHLPAVVCLCRLFMSAAGGQDACLYQGHGTTETGGEAAWIFLAD